jgi:ABC-2 type transport system ATP-binding protein
MQMRLGFAVAAFLEPDVLLVDEALAVGDAAFQQKCLERMRQVLAQGTTLVLVSHDFAAIEATCARGVWLHQGVIEADGPIRPVLGAYRRSIEEAAETLGAVSGVVRLVKAEATAGPDATASTEGPLEIKLVVDSQAPRTGRVFVGISEGPATPIFVVRRDVHLGAGETVVRCTIPHLPLPRGRFYVWTGVYDAPGMELLAWHPATQLDVTGPDLDEAPRAIARLSPVHVVSRWEVETS